MELDIALDIKNTNKNIGIGFDTVNVTYAFPANPDQLMGHGSMEGSEIAPGGVVARSVSSTFEAPLSVLGANVIRDINRGSSDIIVRGNIRGYSTGKYMVGWWDRLID